MFLHIRLCEIAALSPRLRTDSTCTTESICIFNFLLKACWPLPVTGIGGSLEANSLAGLDLFSRKLGVKPHFISGLFFRAEVFHMWSAEPAERCSARHCGLEAGTLRPGRGLDANAALLGAPSV